MLICRSRDQETTCNTSNPDGTQFCKKCGRSLQHALYAYDAGVQVGRYRILRLIDYGSFGAVYEAEVIVNPKVHVALKQSFDPDNIPEFEIEFDILNYLRHPNLPRYYEMFEHDQTAFLSMDFIYGQSLAHILHRQQQPLLEQVVFGYADQICEVLTYLHSHDPPVIHRDIKPQNVLLTSDGVVMLVDFGLVKQGANRRAQGTAKAGTLAYAPPEQWLGGTDTYSDIYNFGATLYHLLTNEQPLSGIYRYSNQPDNLRPPHMINVRITEALSKVVMRAMQIKPNQRYPSIRDMHNALLNARRHTVATRPLIARTIGTTQLNLGTNNLVSRAMGTRSLEAARPGSTTPTVLRQTATRPSTIQPLVQWKAHADMVNVVAWSNDGYLLASAGNDGRIALWRVGTDGLPPTQMRMDAMMHGSIMALDWSPDSDQLVSGGRASKVVMIRKNDGYRLAVWESHGSYITCLRWSPDGKFVASASWEGTVRIWRAEDGYLVAALTGHTQSVNALSWSPDSHQLASSSEGMLRIWDVGQKEAVQVLRGALRTFPTITWQRKQPLVAFSSPHGKIQLQSLTGENTELLCDTKQAITTSAWSPNGQTLASVYAGTMIRIWHPESRNYIQIPQPVNTPISSLAWHPNGQLLAGTTEDRSIYLWALTYA